jgi:hypothetical protein
MLDFLSLTPFFKAPTDISLEYFSFLDPGKTRQNNEDAALIDRIQLPGTHYHFHHSASSFRRRLDENKA